jgi:hypothetical protein
MAANPGQGDPLALNAGGIEPLAQALGGIDPLAPNPGGIEPRGRQFWGQGVRPRGSTLWPRASGVPNQALLVGRRQRMASDVFLLFALTGGPGSLR